MNRLAHNYVVGARSGAALVAAAILAFVLIVSLPRLEELPVSGLELGGGSDSAAPASVAPARVAGKTPAAQGVRAQAGPQRIPSQSHAAAAAPSTTAHPRPHRDGAVAAKPEAISTGDVAGRESSGRAPAPRASTPPAPSSQAPAPSAQAPSTQAPAAGANGGGPPAADSAEEIVGAVTGRGHVGGTPGHNSEPPLSRPSEALGQIAQADPPPQPAPQSLAARAAAALAGDAVPPSANASPQGVAASTAAALAALR